MFLTWKNFWLIVLVTVLDTTIVSSSSPNDLYRIKLVGHSDVRLLPSVSQQALFEGGAPEAQTLPRTAQSDRASGTALPDDQVQALSDLYYATSGDAWFWRPEEKFGAQWDFKTAPVDPCGGWQGVNCSVGGDGDATVTILNLMSYGLNGSMPASIGALTGLRVLELSLNCLVGNIPTEVTNLTNLKLLDFNNNYITGSIPSAIGDLQELEVLRMYYCRMTGPVPSSIGKLGALKMLDIDSNCLSGKLPTQLAEMTSLAYVYMYDNCISGSIPSDLGKLVHLKNFDVFRNRLSGSLPSSIAECTSITLLVANENSLTGSLPRSIGDLPFLETLYLYGNSLTGSIPSGIGGAASLRQLGLHFNRFTGTVPSDMGNLTALEIFDIADNLMHGSIPSSLGNIGGMQYFFVQGNSLSGTIPVEIGSLTGLTIFDITSNRLRGSIPSAVGCMSNLQFLYLKENKLTGALPRGIWSMPELVEIDVSLNQLSGHLADEDTPYVGRNGVLQLINLEYNKFSGRIPTFFGEIGTVVNFLLNNNEFEGPLSGVFVNSTDNAVSVIDVSDNRLTGYIPGELFELSNLTVFAVVNNCFEGSCPSSVCRASQLVTLALDGAGSARSCPGREGMAGKLPSCVFDLPRLETLHAASDGISGQLPAAVPESLRDVVLSHNSLTGTISNALQHVHWSTFDVSHNFLSGALFDTMPTPADDASLRLGSNYISGDIPSGLRSAKDISILEGSLFHCDEQKRELPVHDGQRDSYECGSNTMNIVLYSWLALTVVTISCMIASHRAGFAVTALQPFRQWYKLWRESPLLQVSDLNSFMKSVVCLCVCGLIIFALLMPCFVALKSHYGTYRHQYGWVVGALHMSGTAPGVMIALLWVGISLAFFANGYIRLAVLPVLRRALYRETASSGGDVALVSAEHGSSSLGPAVTDRIKNGSDASPPIIQMRIGLTAVAVLNVAVVMTVYMTYVYVFFTYDSAYSSLLLRLLQFFVAMFQLVLNGRLIPEALSFVAHRLYGSSGTALKEAALINGTRVYGLLVLFNTIGAPVIATACFSTHCLYDYFVPSDEVGVTYSFPKCSTYTLEGEDLFCSTVSEVIRQTSYQPQFSYSYQCSSDFVTYFAPIFMFMFIATSFVIPLLQGIAMLLEIKGIENGIFRLLRVFYSDLNKTLYAIKLRGHEAWNDTDTDRVAVIFKGHLLVANLIKFAAIILTFGVMFPPLGICGCLTVVVHVGVTCVELGRALCQVEHTPSLHAVLLDDIKRTLPMFEESYFVILPFAALFFIFLLNDLLGRAGNDAWVLPIAVSFLCVCFGSVGAWAAAQVLQHGSLAHCFSGWCGRSVSKPAAAGKCNDGDGVRDPSVEFGSAQREPKS